MSKEIYEKLIAPFGKEALSKDLSRGPNNAMTSIKAHYMVERLNTALGVDNWETRYQFTSDGDRGVVCFCELTAIIDGKKITKSSVGACPYVTKSKSGDKPKILGDVYKSAMTDSLGKAASHFGVGNDVFKGLVSANTLNSSAGSNSSYSKPVTQSAKPSFRKPTKSVTVDTGYGDDL